MTRTLEEQLKRNARSTRDVNKAVGPSSFGYFPKHNKTPEQIVQRMLKNPLWRGSVVKEERSQYLITHPKGATAKIFKTLGGR